MCQQGASKTNTKTYLTPFILVIICLMFFSCTTPLQTVSSEEEQEIKSELDDRSFRQFDPSKDAEKRKAVIIDFFNGISLWHNMPKVCMRLMSGRFQRTIIKFEKAGSEYRIYFEGTTFGTNTPDAV